MNWGLLGASSIAAQHVVPAIRRAGGTVTSVFSRSAQHGNAFAQANAIPWATDSLDVLLAAPAVDVVYVSPVNALHAEQVEEAALAGKHVLCEKPLAPRNAADDHAVVVAVIGQHLSAG